MHATPGCDQVQCLLDPLRPPRSIDWSGGEGLAARLGPLVTRGEEGLGTSGDSPSEERVMMRADTLFCSSADPAWDCTHSMLMGDCVGLRILVPCKCRQGMSEVCGRKHRAHPHGHTDRLDELLGKQYITLGSCMYVCVVCVVCGGREEGGRGKGGRGEGGRGYVK